MFLETFSSRSPPSALPSIRRAKNNLGLPVRLTQAMLEQFELPRLAVQDGCGAVYGLIGITLRDPAAASRGLQRIRRQFRRRSRTQSAAMIAPIRPQAASR